MEIERVAVLGGGLMGSGIAETVAIAGFDVVVREVDERALGSARERLETSLRRATDRGKIEPSAAEAVLERIVITADLDAVRDVELVIEAVPEDVTLKTVVLTDVAELVGGETIIASNTSSIPIAQLAAAIPNPERDARPALLLAGSGDAAGRGGRGARHRRMRSSPPPARSSSGSARPRSRRRTAPGSSSTCCWSRT